MLVLTRKLGEKIHIGKEIEVYVVEISRGKVRLGITAPAETRISRSDGPGQKADEQANEFCDE